MGLFNKLFVKSNLSEPENTSNNNEQIEFDIQQDKKYEQAKKVLDKSLEIYNEKHCQCAYPRYQQLINITLDGTGKSFKCYDTDLLIDLSKQYFEIEESKLSDENTNQKWICKKCNSTYEYGWSDFSIYVDRQKLKLTERKTQMFGKPVMKPIPLYLGLMGHSFPSKNETVNVNLTDFEKYMTEK